MKFVPIFHAWVATLGLILRLTCCIPPLLLSRGSCLAQFLQGLYFLVRTSGYHLPFVCDPCGCGLYANQPWPGLFLRRMRSPPRVYLLELPGCRLCISWCLSPVHVSLESWLLGRLCSVFKWSPRASPLWRHTALARHHCLDPCGSKLDVEMLL